MAWTEKRRQRWVGFYRDAEGKTRRAGSDPAKRKALALAQDQEAKIRGGVWHDPRSGTMTLSSYFANEWLPNRNREVLTMRNYVTIFYGAIEPAFGATPLNKLTRGDIQRWVAAMERGDGRDKPLAAGTIRARFFLLSAILGAKKGVSAVFDGLLPGNPCELVTIPAKVKGKVQKYEVAEIETLIAALDEWWRPLVLFQVETGLRWGELMGLTVADFEKDFSVVTVNRTIIRLNRKAAERLGVETSGFMWKDKPKSGESRRVGLSPEAATAVRRLVRERELFPMDRVFSWPDKQDGTKPMRTDRWPVGHPIHEGRFRTEVWLPAHEATGVTMRKLHAMRASHICWLLAGGADIVTVQKRVGHGDLATTQLYVDVMADADARAIDALAVTRGRRKAIGD